MIDFTWEELRALKVNERVHPKTGQPVFPLRFPATGGGFRLCTFEEQVSLIQGLNRSTGRTAGIYVEFKQPAWHATEGKDLGAALLASLDRLGYRRADDPVFVQCFDREALRRLRTVHGTALPLIQLIGEDREDDGIYEAMITPAGLADLATFAQGIGPALGRILTGADAAPTGLQLPGRRCSRRRTESASLHFPYRCPAPRGAFDQRPTHRPDRGRRGGRPVHRPARRRAAFLGEVNGTAASRS